MSIPLTDHKMIVIKFEVIFTINPQSAKKKMHLKMSSAEVVRYEKLPNITDELSIKAIDSVDPEQTAPIFRSGRLQQTTFSDAFFSWGFKG